MILRTKHLPRYRKIGQLLWRHGRSDVFRQLVEASELNDERDGGNGNAARPDALARDLEKMGPTFIKFGQLLSSRADLLPDSYLQALARLQNDVKPFPFEEAEDIIHAELGVRISKAFADFDPKPLAAASLGQVHRAHLRDGREVAVKVQRPHIRAQIAEDFEVLEEVATFLEQQTQFGRRCRFLDLVEQFRNALVQELDYQREAANLIAVGESLREFPRIHIVQPISDYTSRAVLTMTYLRGCKLTELSPVARLDLDGAGLADELFQAYLKQILVDGLFHADPHLGNIFITQDGGVGLLDLGMVGRVTPGMQESLTKLLLSVSEGRAEDAASVAIQISETSDEFDETTFRRRIGELVTEMRERSRRRMDVGRMLLEVSRSSGAAGLYAPSELTMLGKTLLQLHQIGKHLEPSFNPNDAVRRHVDVYLNKRLQKDLTPGNLFSTLLEAKGFLGRLPGRVNKVFDTVGKGQIEFKLRADDTSRLLDGFQKIANRIAAGLVLAALIIGAALLMRVQTRFELFGYPGLAILCFLGAAGGGVWLLLNILLHDRRRKRDQSR
jgi:predicted unusual protein kinase regulating ubiquinone biosynthesis (AarF/ABC1/UbiB family)